MRKDGRADLSRDGARSIGVVDVGRWAASSSMGGGWWSRRGAVVAGERELVMEAALAFNASRLGS